MTELGFLAVFAFAAIGTDDYWQRRCGQADRRTADRFNRRVIAAITVMPRVQVPPTSL